MSAGFFAGSILLGAALAMDAFGVTVAAAIDEHDMRLRGGLLMALVFGIFQFAMPVFGWILVRFFYDRFLTVTKIVPYAACFVLVILGVRMILKSIREKRNRDKKDIGEMHVKADPLAMAPEFSPESGTGITKLLVLGVATSVDALSAGLAMASYAASAAITGALIIGIVTFIICLAGAFLGKKIGIIVAGRASVLSGIILIALGIENLLRNVL